jgi:hypothetical protein
MRTQPEPNQMGSNRVEGNVRIEMAPVYLGGGEPKVYAGD